MRNSLQNSVSSQHKAVVSNSSRASSASSVGGKCFGSLFSCFKITHNREATRYLDNYEHQDYEYVVEKLVVKRIPIAFFGVSRNVSKSKILDSESYSFKEPLATKGNAMNSDTSERSLLYYSDGLKQNAKVKRIPNKYLHLDGNTSTSNERNETGALFPEHDARLTELVNIMTSLHPDLKSSERPPKDPCPLNEPKNKYLPFQRFPEISSNKSLSESDKKKYMQRAFMMPVTDVLQTKLMIKDGNYLDCPEIKLEDEQKIHNKSEDINNNFIGKEIFIVQPTEDIFHNFANIEETVVQTNQSIGDPYDHKQTKTEPSNDKVLCEDLETFATVPKIIKDKLAIANPLPVTVKWKIFVKHCQPKS